MSLDIILQSQVFRSVVCSEDKIEEVNGINNSFKCEEDATEAYRYPEGSTGIVVFRCEGLRLKI